MNTTLLDPPAAPADAEPATTPPRLLTLEEFEQLPDEGRYELLDGELVERTMSVPAGRLVMRIGFLLGRAVYGDRLGELFSSDTGYILFPVASPNRVRYPDASFVAAARLPTPLPPRGHFRFAPDFVLEVASPSNHLEGLVKVEEYLRAGVRLVWLADPASRVVLAFRPDGTVECFPEGGTLRADDLFPGWSALVAELFAGA